MSGRLFAVLLLMLGWSAPPVVGAGDREANRQARRTPVVEVCEKTRGAVVNIAATHVVEVRDMFSELFEEFYRSSPFRPVRGSLRFAGQNWHSHTQFLLSLLLQPRESRTPRFHCPYCRRFVS